MPGKATGSVSDWTRVRSLARRKSKWTMGGCGALRTCGCAWTYERTQFLCVKFRLGSAGEPTICSHCYDVLNEDVCFVLLTASQLRSLYLCQRKSRVHAACNSLRLTGTCVFLPFQWAVVQVPVADRLPQSRNPNSTIISQVMLLIGIESITTDNQSTNLRLRRMCWELWCFGGKSHILTIQHRI